MHRRGLTWLGCGFLVSLLVLVGCSGTMATPEAVTLIFAHSNDPSGSYELWAQQFHDLHPHITLELTTDGSAPGVDVLMATPLELAGLLDAGAILDLSTFIEQSEALDRAEFYPAALDIFRNQGRQWALPFGVDMMVLYFNRDLFDQVGAPYPTVGWTWSDFLARATEVTQPGADVFGYAMQYEGEAAIFEPLMLIYQRGGGIFDSLDAPTRVTFDEPLNIEAMEFYAGLVHTHHVAPTAEEAQRLGRPYPWRGVLDGRFGMWTLMFSERGGELWEFPWQMSWGVVPMPKDAAAGTLALADGLFISAGTDHPAEAWLWIEFLSEQTPPFAIPARISPASSAEFERRVGVDVAEVARAAIADAILVNPQLLQFEAELGALAQAFDQIRSGEAPPEIALVAAQEWADR